LTWLLDLLLHDPLLATLAREFYPDNPTFQLFKPDRNPLMNAYKFLPLVIAAALAACGDKSTSAPETAAPAAVTPVATAPAAAPAATVAVAPPAATAAKGPAPSAEVLAKGETIYTATCLACHGAGVLGAPKIGDKAMWEPRIAKGMDVLYASSINGLKMMPARGGNAALKDDEMKAATDYMVSKVN
jgi:cytochrome c5